MAEHAFAQTDNSGVNEESLRMVSATPIGNEPVSDEELRPHVLDGFIGQPRLKAQLQLFLDAARKREVPPDHILLAGPPGLGKTTLAMIVANELAVPIRVTSGPAIQHAGDLASILSSLDAGEVLFIDEIHRLPRAAEELLYMRLDACVRKPYSVTASWDTLSEVNTRVSCPACRADRSAAGMRTSYPTPPTLISAASASTDSTWPLSKPIIIHLRRVDSRTSVR